MAWFSFFKMSGGGNDFLVMDNRQKKLSLDAQSIAGLCRRGLSVGADGVMFIEHSRRADFRLRHFNADGREAVFCGNGLRCGARFALLHVIAPRRMHIETACGVMGAEVQGERVTIDMPSPHMEDLNLSLLLDGKGVTGHLVTCGVPHFIILVDDVETCQVQELGSTVRRHARFAPDGTNVDFVSSDRDASLSIRTYERGVEGETLSCGTGCVAATALLHKLRNTGFSITCHTRSGVPLQVEGHSDFSATTLTGDARVIYEAELWDEALPPPTNSKTTSGETL